MNLFKIVQKRTDKGSGNSSPLRDAGTVLLFVFLLPYVVSCLWGHVGEEVKSMAGQTGEESEWIDEKYELTLVGNHGNRKISMRDYLIEKLETVMENDEESGLKYEQEALKAQAVLLRTKLWEIILNDGGSASIQDDISMYAADTHKSETVKEAVSDTDGIYLAYENYPIKAAYFPVSSGHTRNAKEVWDNDSYPYLAGAECSQDISAREYQSSVSVPKEEYCKTAEKIFTDVNAKDVYNSAWDNTEFTCDSAGYVLRANIGSYVCDGELFRNAFGLNSSCFEAEWKSDEVIFNVKGVGHGFGMSQYGANERAVSGETFDQILKYYFFNTELAKIE